jgi:hypothetical protein
MKATDQSEIIRNGKTIVELSEKLKTYIISQETGKELIDENFIKNETWLGETYTSVYFDDGSSAKANYKELSEQVKQYNQLCAKSSLLTIEGFAMLVPGRNERVYESLNNLVQLQLFVLQNERLMADSKSESTLLGSL